MFVPITPPLNLFADFYHFFPSVSAHRWVTQTDRVKAPWLGQTSSLGRVEPINWIGLKGTFSRTKLTCLVRRTWRSTFVLQAIFRGSIRLIQLLVQTNLHVTEPDVELFMNVTHYVWFVSWKLMKSSTFGLGLTWTIVRCKWNKSYKTCENEIKSRMILAVVNAIYATA